MRRMFEGFERRFIEANGTRIHTRVGGGGPPLLLIHGYPQNGSMWHAVAPSLAARFSVVVPDLRGYGDSDAPEADPEHVNYSKRTMARDLVEVMRALGFERFSVAGHDRGARVTYRMALDHPDAVVKLATLDIVPTLSTWRAMDWRGAIGSFHWQLLAQPSPIPERLIGADPMFWLHTMLARWAAPGFQFDPEAMADYERCFRRPETIFGSCEDYRAGASADVRFDEEDFGRRKIAAPLLALWGDRGGRRTGLLETWREWAEDVRGEGVPCGHFLPEEAPDRTLSLLAEFFAD
jgi:haloacetate dehalogenase